MVGAGSGVGAAYTPPGRCPTRTSRKSIVAVARPGCGQRKRTRRRREAPPRCMARPAVLGSRGHCGSGVVRPGCGGGARQLGFGRSRVERPTWPWSAATCRRLWLFQPLPPTAPDPHLGRAGLRRGQSGRAGLCPGRDGRAALRRGRVGGTGAAAPCRALATWPFGLGGRLPGVPLRETVFRPNGGRYPQRAGNPLAKRHLPLRGIPCLFCRIVTVAWGQALALPPPSPVQPLRGRYVQGVQRHLR